MSHAEDLREHHKILRSVLVSATRLFSYAGICDSRPVGINLALSRAPSRAIEEVCINERLKLLTKLKNCDRTGTDKRTTIAETQSELSKTRSEQDRARGQ